MSPSAPPEPWHSFFRELDEAVTETVRLDCIGGFVVTQMYGLARPTADVDVVELAPKAPSEILTNLAYQGGPLHHKYRVYLDRVTVASVPYEYETRLTEMFPGLYRYLRLMALDPYDLALTKLERNSQKDRDDVKFLFRKLGLNVAVLEERYHKELRALLGVPNREDLTLKLWIEMVTES